MYIYICTNCGHKGKAESSVWLSDTNCNKCHSIAFGLIKSLFVTDKEFKENGYKPIEYYFIKK